LLILQIISFVFTIMQKPRNGKWFVLSIMHKIDRGGGHTIPEPIHAAASPHQRAAAQRRRNELKENALIDFVGRKAESVASISGPGMRLTLAVTGASGSIFAAEMLRALDADARIARVDFIPSDAALRVFAEEMKLSGRNGMAEKLLGRPGAPGKIVQHSEADIGASVASGSYRSDGMIVLPCTMGTLAGIANGMASNLIERAADVCLKEGRRLILCVRETPFNRIHLRNMQLAADAGATIFPVMPSLYNMPKDTTEMARQFVNRVLAYLGLPQAGAYEWKAD
jgi:4-hydroxy-3-polyprenylbenzoate decarboxylase